MKPVEPLQWEPSKIAYLAWQEIHSRAHAIQDKVLAGGAVNLTQVTNLLNSQPLVALSLDDSSQEELIFPYQTPAPAAAAAAPVPVLNLEDSTSDELTILYQTSTTAPAAVAAPVLDLDDAAQEDIPLGFPILTSAANPSASVGLTAVNGTATTYLRSDGAPALSQSIVPNWTGAHTFSSTIAASGNPLSATVTRAQTGLAGFRATDATSTNATLTADASLTLTFNETGSYTFEIWLPFWEAALGTGGFQFDLNSGTATVGTIVYGVEGFSTASVINAGVTSVATATAAGSIATSSSAPSWFLSKGYLKITVAGTLAVRWAQNAISANATTLMTGAYFTVTKIG